MTFKNQKDFMKHFVIQNTHINSFFLLQIFFLTEIWYQEVLKK